MDLESIHVLTKSISRKRPLLSRDRLVHPASHMCLSQRWSPADPSIRGRDSEAAKGSLNQLSVSEYQDFKICDQQYHQGNMGRG